MVSKHKGVCFNGDVTFFDKVFEPSRKDLEKKLGIKIGQQKFTRMIKGFKFNLNLKNELKNESLKKFKKK
jgi:hypothetical protein